VFGQRAFLDLVDGKIGETDVGGIDLEPIRTLHRKVCDQAPEFRQGSRIVQ
jgi:hypothetical protein